MILLITVEITFVITFVITPKIIVIIIKHKSICNNLYPFCENNKKYNI